MPGMSTTNVFEGSQLKPSKKLFHLANTVMSISQIPGNLIITESQREQLRQCAEAILYYLQELNKAETQRIHDISGGKLPTTIGFQDP